MSKQYRVEVKNKEEANMAQDLFEKLGSVKRTNVDDRYPKLIVTELSRKHGDWHSSGAPMSNKTGELITMEQLRQMAKQQQGLISGAEAKLAWAKGDQVKYKGNLVNKWAILGNHNPLSVFDDSDFTFRIKPKVKKIKLEIPEITNIEAKPHVLTIVFKDSNSSFSFMEQIYVRKN